MTKFPYFILLQGWNNPSESTIYKWSFGTNNDRIDILFVPFLKTSATVLRKFSIVGFVCANFVS